MNSINSVCFKLKPQNLSPDSVAHLFLLFLGLVAVSFSSIFISLSEKELSSNSTIFNRFWITSIIYGLWMGSRYINNYDQCQIIENNSYSNRQITLDLFSQYLNQNQYIIRIIICLGVCFCANQIIWSLSLEHTSIANSKILHNLTPIFTVLGARLFLNQLLIKSVYLEFFLL